MLHIDMRCAKLDQAIDRRRAEIAILLPEFQSDYGGIVYTGMNPDPAALPRIQ
jgi:hypothetical protein